MSNTLWSLREGEAATIDRFAPSLNPVWLRRLKELGFTSGEEVTCVTAPRFGAPRVYRVGATFFSVESQIAEQLLVADPA
ncbi:MAG: FeoA family protein [Pseudomonadota bacterium]